MDGREQLSGSSAPDGRAARVDRVLTASTVAAIAIAMMVLLGWLVDVETLKRFQPAWPSTKTNTALAVLLAGMSLLLLRGERPPRRRVIAAWACAASVTLLATLTLSQDLVGWNLGIDELVFEESRPAPTIKAPNRMAPNTSIALVLVGAALLLQRRRGPGGRVAAQSIGVALATVSYLALVGYLYGVSDLFWIGPNTAMSLVTALALLLLSVAILSSRPHGPLVTILVSDRLGGHLARRLLPAAVLVPTLLGLLALAGKTAGLYDTQFGTAALISASVLLFGAVAWWNAMVLDRLDGQRLDALQVLEDESRARDLERRRLRAVLDVLPVGVFLADASGRLVETNHAAKEIWAQSPLVGKVPEYGDYRGWWPDTGVQVQPEQWGLARSLTRGEVCVAEEIEIQAFDGRRRTILNYAAPVRDEEGMLAGGVAVNVDITDRKRAELDLRALKDELDERVRRRTAELAAANAELEAFSYSVSHDLRAPLRWVDGFTQALAEEYADRFDETGRDYVRQIRESVQRMSELIDALLRLSRITRAPLESADVDLTRMARAIASGLEASGAPRGVEWAIGEDIHSRGDPELVHIVLDNLLRNAWKFSRTREVARIELGAMVQGGEPVFFVRDNGVGFDMAYVDKLFRSFERLHRTEQFEGTGVGLALVGRIVQRHGGRAWAEGRLDEGATFFFTLGPPGESQ